LIREKANPVCPQAEKRNAHEEIAFADEQKPNACEHLESAFPD